MPDGERKQYKCKFPNMLSKLFSFFQCKHKLEIHTNIQENVDNWSHYKNLKAEDIMVPRTDIVAMDYKNTLEDISNIFLKSRHTRMPVYKENLDNIVGFINIKDIFPYFIMPEEKNKFAIEKVIRKLLIISPSMKILDLLEEMKKTRTHIAFVVDEFGGTDGLITIEDLVEEIIGEIEDEHDQTKAYFKEVKPNHFEANGRIEIEVLEESLGINLTERESEKYDTLGGLILSICGHIPEKGEKVTHFSSGAIFEILESDPRRIKKVLIIKPEILTK